MSDVVDAEKVADSPRLPVAAKIPGKSDAEIPPPHIRLMEALSCTEEELNAAVEKASKGKFHSFFELNSSQQEKLAANPDRLKPLIG